MDRPMFGRASSIALGLLLLNVVVLAAGLALEHWRAQPRALVGYNADKVRLLNKAGAVPAPGSARARCRWPRPPGWMRSSCPSGLHAHW